MAVTLRATTHGVAAVGITPPTGTQVGDIVIASCCGFNVAWSAPDASWTQIRSDISNFGVLTLFTKVVDAGDLSGTWTFTYTGGSFGGSPDYNVILIDTFADALGVLSSGDVAGSVSYPAITVVADGLFYGVTGWGKDDPSSPGANPPLVETGAFTNSTHVWVMGSYFAPLLGTETTSAYNVTLGTSAFFILSSAVVLSPAPLSGWTVGYLPIG